MLNRPHFQITRAGKPCSGSVGLGSIEVRSGVAFIRLQDDVEAMVDVADIALVSSYRWHHVLSGDGRNRYVRCRIKVGGVWAHMLLHRFLVGATHGAVIDHIDGDGLNNQRSNLRLASKAQNAWNRGKASHNSTGYKGVIVDPSTGKWFARITAHGQTHRSEAFPSAELAHKAYCEMATRLHGEFANFGEGAP